MSSLSINEKFYFDDTTQMLFFSIHKIFFRKEIYQKNK